jgi:membrane protein required for colicin V production
MNYFDIIIAVVLVWAFYSGYKKGAIYMLISFIAIIVGVYAAVFFSYLLVGKIGEFIHTDPEKLKVISYILTFVIVFGFLHLIGKILDKFLQAIALGFVNRLIGGGISVAMKILILALVLWMFDQGNKQIGLVNQKKIDNSVMFNPIKNLAPVIWLNVKKLKDNEFIKKIKETEKEIRNKRKDSISN